MDSHTATATNPIVKEKKLPPRPHRRMCAETTALLSPPPPRVQPSPEGNIHRIILSNHADRFIGSQETFEPAARKPG